MLTINNMGNVNQNTVYRKLSKEISLTFLKSINIQKTSKYMLIFHC